MIRLMIIFPDNDEFNKFVHDTFGVYIKVYKGKALEYSFDYKLNQNDSIVLFSIWKWKDNTKIRFFPGEFPTLKYGSIEQVLEALMDWL